MKRFLTLAIMMVCAVGAWADDEVYISTAKEWKFDNVTLETGTTTQNIDGLCFKGLNSTNSGYGVKSGSKSGEYSDGTTWSASCYAASPNGSDLSTVTGERKATATTGGSFYRSFAFNVNTPGTCYVIFGTNTANSDRKFKVYFNYENGNSWTMSSKETAYTTTPTEVKLCNTTSGTYWLNGTPGGTYYVYAVRFVPESVTKPTISVDNGTITITDGTSNLTGDGNVTIKTYYTTDGNYPTTLSDEYDPSNKPTVNSGCTIKAISVNTKSGTTSEIGTLDVYSITTATGLTGGSISTDKSIAVTGETITLTATSAEGYSLNSISVTDSSDGAIEVSNNTFTMPASNVNVSASFTKDKVAGTISFSESSISKSVGAENFTIAATNSGDGNIVYSSSNESTATVNSATGEVTIVGTGETTITATVTDSENYTYETKTASYTLTVTEAQTLYKLTIGNHKYGPLTVSCINENETWSQVAAGTTVTVNAGEATTAGYKFSSVRYFEDNNTNNKTTINNNSFVMPEMDITIEVVYTKVDLSVTSNIPNGNGTLSFTSSNTPNTKFQIGNTVTITVSPEDDYKLKEGTLVATYNGSETLTLAKVEGQDNQYSFTMPGYDVTVSAEFESTTIILTNDNVSVAPATYNGSEQTAVVKYNETPLTKGTDYTVTEGTDTLTDAGSTTFLIQGMGDYSGTVSLTFTIDKASYTVTGSVTATYGTQVKDIAINALTVKDVAEAVVAGTWAFPGDNTTIPEVENETAYTATFTPTTQNDNYNALTKDIIPTITKKEVTVAGITANNKVYDGNTTATLVLEGATIEGKVGEDELTLASATGTFADANVGENKVVTISDITFGGAKAGNYTIATTGSQTSTTATITQATNALTGELSIDGWAYGEVRNEPTGVTATFGTVAYKYSNAEAGEYGTYEAFVNGAVGTWWVKAYVEGTQNYTAVESSAVSFTISKAVFTLTTSGYEGTYDGASHGITVSANVDATIRYRTTDSGDYDLTENPQYTDVGTYTVYYQVTKDNYTTVEGSLTVTINQANMSELEIADIADQSYTGSEITPEITVTLSGNAITAGDKTFEVSYADNTGIGTATITLTPKEAGNLTGESRTKDFNIIKANMASKVTATGWNSAYDGAEHGITVTVTEEGAITKYGTTEGTYDLDSSPVFKDVSTNTIYYKVTKDNFEDVTGSESIVISQKPLTISAKDQTITRGESIATGIDQVTVTGLVSGESLTSITLTPSTTAVTTDGKITPSDAQISPKNDNYNITYVDGTLIINAIAYQENDSNDSNTTESYGLIDDTHAELTSVTTASGASSVTIPASANNVPVTSIASDAFSSISNKNDIKSIDLSATSITEVEVSRSNGVFSGFPEETIIYMPTGNTVATGQNNVVINGTCTDFVMADEKSYSIPKEFTATSATLSRTFTESKTCTVCLPYGLTVDEANSAGSFYSFSSVNGNKVIMTQKTGGLVANMPYIFVPNSDTGNNNKFAASNVTVSMSNDPKAENTGFTFKGVYSKKTFTQDEINSGVYGFAAGDGYGANIGQFVKGSLGTWVEGMRAYLEYNGTLNEAGTATTRSSNLPDVLTLVLMNANGTTTDIGRLELMTAEDGSAVYNLKGQRVDSSYKGMVIKNGKKVVIK